MQISKNKSSYDIQKELIEKTSEENLINDNSEISHNFIYPRNYVFFHYKQNLFENLLGWDLQSTTRLLKFLSENFENVLFSSEINNYKVNNFFHQNLTLIIFLKIKKVFLIIKMFFF